MYSLYTMESLHKIAKVAKVLPACAGVEISYPHTGTA
jgi:hypothetical protein